MKRKSFVPWLLLIVFALAVMSGGCSDEGSGGGSYSFRDLEGTWILTSGSGTGSGSVGGITISGSATAVEGYVTFSKMSELGGGSFYTEIEMLSAWDVTFNPPYEDYSGLRTLGFDYSHGDGVEGRQEGSNVFVFSDTEDGANIRVRIALTSSTTANVDHMEEYNNDGIHEKYDVKYSISKQ